MARPLKVKKLSTDDPAHKAARRILRTRLKEYFSVWPDPDQKPTETQLHDLRISGKRLRYSAESLREFYPDRLSLLIELLKRGQDLLGEIQDCRSQRELLKNDLARLKKRRPHSAEARTLARIIAEFEPQMASLHRQFEEIWRGLSARKLQKSLRAMVSNPVEPNAPSITIDEAGDVPGSKSVINVDHGNV